jgi:carboxypeptidase C (cathepsin A)
MRLRIRFFTMVIFVLTAAVLPSTAQQTASAAPAAPAEEDSTRPPYKVVTNHTMTISGKQIAYSATVEEIFSLNDQGERTASLVSISYVRTDSRNVSQRPVIFAFNGGPGSASLWQHLGLLGPCRVLFQDTVSEEEIHPKTTPPFLYGPNPDCLLDLADIVLFDPPGTGFSRDL